MPQRSRNSHARAQSVRRDIASLAARIMAQDGIGDYGFAKRKAAKQLGVPDTDALPDNEEIEAELRAYQSIYQEEEQKDRVRELRRIALDVMRLLSRFSPYLVGHVLEGTAGRFASVQLRLFPSASKDVEIFLLSREIPYTHVDPRRANGEPPEMQIELEWDGVTVEIAVFEPDQERMQRRNPRTGKVFERASLGAVEALVNSDRP